MGGIIIAMPNPDNARKIGEILRGHGFDVDAYCKLGSEVLQNANQYDGGVVLCTPKLKDMGYVEMLEYLPNYYEMLLLTKDVDVFDPYEHLVKLANPFRTIDLINTVDMMLERLYPRPKRKKPLAARSRTGEEQKMIDDAKKLLMMRNEMTEPEAFRYIQKNSMDSGRTLVESAQMVLMLNGDW